MTAGKSRHTGIFCNKVEENIQYPLIIKTELVTKDEQKTNTKPSQTIHHQRQS